MLTTTSINVSIPVEPNLPFPVGEKSIMWLEVVSTRANTATTGRFSGMLHNDVDF